MDAKLIEIFEKEDFSNWLAKNHGKERKIGLVIHKKHTGKKSPSHHELILEGIRYGWIDTTIKRLDENKFIRFFVKRNEKSRWSYNTLGYAKKLVREKRMAPSGMKAYNEGRKNLPHDYGLPAGLRMPSELKKILQKKSLLEDFSGLSPSAKKTYLRWIARGKQEKTRKKRIDSLMDSLSKKNQKK